MKIKKSRKDEPQKSDSPMQCAENMTDFRADQTDPQGSYTGRPVEPYEKPVQDVDDL